MRGSDPAVLGLLFLKFAAQKSILFCSHFCQPFFLKKERKKYFWQEVGSKRIFPKLGIRVRAKNSFCLCHCYWKPALGFPSNANYADLDLKHWSPLKFRFLVLFCRLLSRLGVSVVERRSGTTATLTRRETDPSASRNWKAGQTATFLCFFNNCFLPESLPHSVEFVHF